MTFCTNRNSRRYPSQPRRRRSLSLALSMFALARCAALPACCAEDDEASLKRKAAILAGRITVDRRDGDVWRPARRMEQPVLYYGDETRNNSNGSVWIWGEPGRPAALMELYQPADRPDDWVFVLTSLSREKLLCRRSGKEWWMPASGGLEFQPVEIDAPTASKAGRLIQMKKLARRFSAHEFWDPNNSRFELRLLASPIHRYDDAAQGLVDAAIFAFSNGTNPEVLLLIEAVSNASGAAGWQFGCARLGHAEMHAMLDDREVWTVPRVDRMPNTSPYWLHYELIPNIE